MVLQVHTIHKDDEETGPSMVGLSTLEDAVLAAMQMFERECLTLPSPNDMVVAVTATTPDLPHADVLWLIGNPQLLLDLVLDGKPLKLFGQLLEVQ